MDMCESTEGAGPLPTRTEATYEPWWLSRGDRKEQTPPSPSSQTCPCRGPDVPRFCLRRRITCAGLYTDLLRWEVVQGDLSGPLVHGEAWN